MRNYNSFEDDRKTIVQEVVTNGNSTGWFFNTETEAKLASDLEKDLKKYNIGFINAKDGKWSHRLNGTRYFMAYKFLGAARNKMNNLMDSFKK